jgi:CheY-like chemotaxis protein
MPPLQALIVDDNPLNLDVLATLLETQGVQSHRMLSPAELPDALDQLPALDVIFLDLEFPHHNGFDVLRELQNSAQLTTIPIVAYSVHISEIEVARQAGFDGFLGKPIGPTRFPEQLQQILEGGGVWDRGGV